MRVLGIDCGSERTGFGVVDSDGVRHSLVAAGTIISPPKLAFQERLRKIATELRDVIQAHRPESAAVEEVFHAVNVRTVLKLAQVRGVALLVLAESGLEAGEYSPLLIKTSVVGYGRAGKAQVQMMVQSLLRLENAIASEDASDALAVAICHATQCSSQARVARAVVR